MWGLEPQILGTPQTKHQHHFRHMHRLMQIHLPVHQAAGNYELFNGVDRLHIRHQFVIAHVQHFNDTFRTDNPFGHTRKKTVSGQIVQPVNIQLAGNQLVQKPFWIHVLKNPDGQGQTPFILTVQRIHEE